MTTLFCVSNPISYPSAFTSLRAAPFFNSPVLSIPCGGRKRRGSAVAIRAGPSTSSILFAIALPSSLLGVTILAALRMGNKLDQDWLEEIARNEALMELEEFDNGDDDSKKTYAQEEQAMQEEPVLTQARNRPKREA